MKRHAIYLTIFLGFIFGFGLQTAQAGDPSPNDNFADATPVVLANGTASISSFNWDATKEPNEPNHAENVGGNSVWFKFTPTATSVFLIKATNNTFDTTMAVYTGNSVGSLQLVGFNDDCNNNCGSSSVVNLMMTAGTTYYIAVDGFNDQGVHGRGNFDLQFTEYNPPINDNLSGAMNLGANRYGSIAVTNYNASLEANEPSIVNSGNGVKSVWFRWGKTNVPQSMEFEVKDTFNSQIIIYSAPTTTNNFADLTMVTWNVDNFGDNISKHRIRFFAETGKYYYIVVAGHNYVPAHGDSGNFQLSFRPSKFKYSADSGERDPSSSVTLFRPSEGRWYSMERENSYYFTNFKWGIDGDTPMAADYDGDGRSTATVARNENGLKVWYLATNPAPTIIQWGLASDKPIVGDFDNDGRGDIAVIRLQAQGYVWYVRQSSNGQMRTFVFGTTGDRPVLGDFDGDNATDVAVVRNTQNGLVWYVLKSDLNTYNKYFAANFGLPTDIVAPEDYDGDGKTDIAVFRPSEGKWYILRSSTGEIQATPFGSAGDKPQPTDYDGDGKSELAVFRPSTGDWYFWFSQSNTQKVIHFGTNGDIPVSSLSTLSQ